MLDQEHASEVAVLLDRVPTNRVFISDFSLHSIGVILFRLKNTPLFHDFLVDLFRTARIRLVRLQPLEHLEVIKTHKDFALDFDDAYQVKTASKHRLALVTYDSDFKSVQRINVMHPKDVIKKHS
jgi:predicted nucleic acid-binding protein